MFTRTITIALLGLIATVANAAEPPQEPTATRSPNSLSRIAKPKELVVRLDLAGRITVAGKSLSTDELLTILRGARGDTRDVDTVIVRGDENCPLKHVVGVMNLCAKAEIRDVRISVAKDDSGRRSTESRSTEPRTTAAAVEQAHGELWRRFVDSHGIVRDFVGELPAPDDCKLGRPNAIGWWSPIENGPMFTGIYLAASCERARRSGAEADREAARTLARGLIKCASVSDVAGFIARGIGTDGTCHYPLGSDDQTHPWFYGLHVYLKSDIPAADERAAVTAKFREVAAVLEATGWRCPADGAFRGQFRGGYRGHLFRDAVRYLYLLRACRDVTGDEVWLERYRKALAERPHGSEQTRLELCAAGFAHDRTAIAHLDDFQLWIYVGCQASLQKLIELETDESIRSSYRLGLTANAAAALRAVEAYASFDNGDTKLFGNADWRAVYSAWYPQPTQADAERLAQTGDKAKQGGRKSYEQRFMRNPLAGAAIAAFGGDETMRPKIEQALRHYDYEKVHMAEFFLAEVAYYALPPK